MNREKNETRWFWVTLLLTSVSVVMVVFAAWELVENRFFRDVDYVTLHYLYISRGVVSSLLLAVWAAWHVLRVRRRSEDELRRSWEHYRNLLEVSPGAVALFDSTVQVSEWNATAERLYGFSKMEVLGHRLPTVLPETEAELRRFMEEAQAGRAVVDIETRRTDSTGRSFDVQMSLLPFREAPGVDLFLEVTADISERVKLREKLLEVEKLTSMGKMAAGTAHHLNTPLAVMLLRVQMMRERFHRAPCLADLEELENDIVVCRQFVQRLLDFGRRPAAQKEPVDVTRSLESVASFLSPALSAKRADFSVDLDGARGGLVLADRNLIEALFLILLSNAIDAISEGGSIRIRCLWPQEGRIEIQIADDGCGIPAGGLALVFEPFYTTKGSGKGTGLGLAIARNIVLDHGGSIRLEPGLTSGTIARVDLPVWVSAPVAAESAR
jgi:PAS domain S-box-containing protein